MRISIIKYFPLLFKALMGKMDRYYGESVSALTINASKYNTTFFYLKKSIKQQYC